MKTTLSNRRGGGLAGSIHYGKSPRRVDGGLLFVWKRERTTAAAAAESGSDVSVTTQFERQHTIGLRIEWNEEEEGSEKRKQSRRLV
jgi:hypothetical protein